MLKYSADDGAVAAVLAESIIAGEYDKRGSDRGQGIHPAEDLREEIFGALVQIFRACRETGQQTQVLAELYEKPKAEREAAKRIIKAVDDLAEDIEHTHQLMHTLLREAADKLRQNAIFALEHVSALTRSNRPINYQFRSLVMGLADLFEAFGGTPRAAYQSEGERNGTDFNALVDAAQDALGLESVSASTVRDILTLRMADIKDGKWTPSAYRGHRKS